MVNVSVNPKAARLALAHQTEVVRRNLDALVTDPFLGRLAVALTGRIPRLADNLVRRIFAEDLFYGETGPPVFERLRGDVENIIGQMIRGVAGTEPVQLDQAEAVVRQAAGDGVPLATILRIFRMGGQLILEEALADQSWRQVGDDVDTVLTGSSALWELINSYSELIGHVYDQVAADRFRRSERDRSLVLDALMDGRVQDLPRMADVARFLDLSEHGEFVVVVSENPAAGEEGLAGIEAALRAESIRSVWHLRSQFHLGIVVVADVEARPRQREDAQSNGGHLAPRPSRSPRELQAGNGHDSGYRQEPILLVRDIIDRKAVGRVGISPVYGFLGDSALHVGLADLARRCLPPESVGVALFDEHPLEVLAAQAPELAERVLTLILGSLFEADEADVLIDTLSTWIEVGGSTTTATERLFCHRNTLRNRLERIEQLAGRSLSCPSDLADVCVAIKILRMTTPI